jgi:hypothetical protein
VPLEEHFADLSAFLAGLVSFTEEDTPFVIESARLDLPFELAVGVEPDGAVRLLAAPPTQHISTTVMPALHHLTVEASVRGDD